MPKKAVPVLALLILAACFVSYKLGSAPVAFAKPRSAPQDAVTPSLPPPPAEWSLYNLQVSKSFGATVNKPGVAGVQHVADCIMASGVTATGSTISGPINVTLFDGNTAILALYLPQPYASNGQGQLSLCGLSLQGTAGNNMNLSIGGYLGATPWTSVTLVGHDAT